MNTITPDNDYQTSLMVRCAQMGATMALQQAGVIKTTITLAEIKRLHGATVASEARTSPAITWVPVGKGGRTSGVYCQRAEFEKYLFTRDFSFINAR